MWYLPAETATVVGGTDSRKNREVAANNVCATNVAMKKYVDLDPKNSLLDKCCMPASYFENKPKT